MLAALTDQTNSRWLFRLDRPMQIEALLNEIGVDESGAEEIRILLAESGYSPGSDQLLDRTFELEPRPSRFSDGSFPVLYGSLEKDTAEAEIKHWMPKRIGQPVRPRTVHYQVLQYRFEGVEKDLRPKLGDWPDLTHDSDYSFCNRLGAEAIELGTDGLLTPSARHPTGSNQPVFSRRAVGRAVLDAEIAMTYEPASGKVSVRHFDE